MITKESINIAYETNDISVFLDNAFPMEWLSVKSRILETGVQISPNSNTWAARLSDIPMTMRHGDINFITKVKSVIFRVHDCIHQLWGLPDVGSYSSDDKYFYKRAQMCGEIAVLTITEFLYTKILLKNIPELKEFLDTRNALPLLIGPLGGKSYPQIAARLDGLLHRQLRPKWVRENSFAQSFCDDYVPMMERDRVIIDTNWDLMKSTEWVLSDSSPPRYDKTLDGLELTVWMVEDFFRLINTNIILDKGLMMFNRDRRSKISMPFGWTS